MSLELYRVFDSVHPESLSKYHENNLTVATQEGHLKGSKFYFEQEL
jgi:hypothetical protein